MSYSPNICILELKDRFFPKHFFVVNFNKHQCEKRPAPTYEKTQVKSASSLPDLWRARCHAP